MMRTVGKLFGYFSSIFVLALGTGLILLAARGQLSSDRMGRITAALRGESIDAAEPEAPDDPYAGLAERQISDNLVAGVRGLDMARQRWLDQQSQAKAMAETRIALARSEFAKLQAARSANQTEADRLEKLLKAYDERIVSQSITDAVERMAKMRPKDVVEMVSQWKDEEIAKHILEMKPDFSAKVFKELTKLVGPKRSGEIFKEVERQQIEPEA